MTHQHSNWNAVAVRHAAVPSFIVASVAACVLAACGGGGGDPVGASRPALDAEQQSSRRIAITPGTDVIAYWNQIATNTVNVPPAANGTPEERRPVLQP